MKALFALIPIALLVGCGATEHAHDAHEAAPATDTTHASTADTSMTQASTDASSASEGTQIAEVACGHCVYQKDLGAGCYTAVKLGDDVLTLKGVEDRAELQHLCSESVQVKIEGHVEGDTFIATNVVPTQELPASSH
jgi:hypothetical protein